MGTLNIRLDALGGAFLNTLTTPVYNMVAPPGAPAELGINVIGTGPVVHIEGKVRTGGDYGLTGDVSGIGQEHLIFGSKLTLWGDPSDPSHNRWRGACAGHNDRHDIEIEGVPDCPVEPASTPLLTMPTACPGTPLESSATADSWQEPNVWRPYEWGPTSPNRHRPLRRPRLLRGARRLISAHRLKCIRKRAPPIVPRGCMSICMFLRARI